MFKKAVFAGLGVALLAAPLLASADTVSEIQARIDSLLAQIVQLQEQLKQLTATNPTPPEPVRPIDRICPQILRTLDQGIEGSDVKELQAYLGVTQTGYFGPMTARAVSSFQADEGLNQVGIVGPQTRAAFARRCGLTVLSCPVVMRTACPTGQHYETAGPDTVDSNGCRFANLKCVSDTTTSTTFTASPTSGATPLGVDFTSNTTGGTINFGDGTTGVMNPAPTCYTCAPTSKASHTYTSAGTYTATLYSGPYPSPDSTCPPNGMCSLSTPVILGTVTITVSGNGGGTNNPTFTASPTSGPAPLAVEFTTGSIVNGTGSYTINFGDGTSGTASPDACTNSIPGSCSYSASHTYASVGTYTAQLIRGSDGCAGWTGPTSCTRPVSREVIGTVTITVRGATVTPTLTAQPTSGTVPLSVVFTTNRQDAAINFGDGTSGAVSPNCTTGLDGSGNCNTGSYLATHTYTSAGTYMATLTTAGSCTSGYCAQTASVTITVTGGSTACEVTDIYAESVPGYVYYNLFMKVRNLPGSTSTTVPVVSITGAESWDNLTFSQVGYSGGITTLQASQTVNGTGINYIMERKYVIRPVSSGTTPITCTPMGGGGVAYPVPVTTYPTQTANRADVSAGNSSANLASALTALESAIKAFIAKLGQ